VLQYEFDLIDLMIDICSLCIIWVTTDRIRWRQRIFSTGTIGSCEYAWTTPWIRKLPQNDSIGFKMTRRDGRQWRLRNRRAAVAAPSH